MVKPTQIPPVEGRPTSELIADQLRRLVIDGSFLPGEQVLESEVATQLQLSRGPVREALHRLCQEGLLISHRNRGVFVAELTRQDVAEVYSAREAIELAAAKAIINGDWDTLGGPAVHRLESLITKMPGVAKSGDRGARAALDLNFHTALVESAQNSRLTRIYRTLAAEACMSMLALVTPEERALDLVEEHREILRLLAARDLPGVERAISQHLSLKASEISPRPRVSA